MATSTVARTRQKATNSPNSSSTALRENQSRRRLEELRSTHTVHLSHIDGAVVAASLQAGEEHLTWTQLASSQWLVDEIDDALRRIDNNKYGECEDCGNLIPPERLETIPHARRCVTCQGRSHGSSTNR